MKFRLENIGPINSAEIEFGNLTVLCGRNNTGKTYITYNAFNYIHATHEYPLVPEQDTVAEALLAQGEAKFQLPDCADSINAWIKTGMSLWATKLSYRAMGAHKELYKDTQYTLTVEDADVARFKHRAIGWPVKMTRGTTIHINKPKDTMQVTLSMQNMASTLPEKVVISRMLLMMLSILLAHIIPDIFVITCERTGIATFRSLLLAANQSKGPNEPEKEINEEYKLQPDFCGYPQPMCKDLQFLLNLDTVIQQSSCIAENHPEIIQYFNEMVGGQYQLQEPNIVKFVPEGAQAGLTTVECSSAVRSLMELNFYLKHKARYGQILMIDEPEQNLHPENQRKIARLLAMLVNVGIRVWITTHSDYIIREFNTLMSLHRDIPRLQAIAKELQFDKDHQNCLLDPAQVRAYAAEAGTATPLKITAEYGIEQTAFDSTIEAVNQLQARIIFGD